MKKRRNRTFEQICKMSFLPSFFPCKEIRADILALE